MREVSSENRTLTEARADFMISERKVVEKNQEIDILKETVRGLYLENEKLVEDKRVSHKEISTLKESNTSLKKKLKRAE